jgi:hypoxanthine phosphoribosyltransferase
MGKVFIQAAELERDSWEFAKQLHQTGIHFDWVVGLTRGGVQISIYIQEALSLLSGHKKFYSTIHAQSYTDIGKAGGVILGQMDHLINLVKKEESILVIDDVFDRGRTLEAVYENLELRLKVFKTKIYTGALYYKQENSQVSLIPDFHFKNFGKDEWLVFPHELCGLNEEELKLKGFYS